MVTRLGPLSLLPLREVATIDVADCGRRRFFLRTRATVNSISGRLPKEKRAWAAGESTEGDGERTPCLLLVCVEDDRLPGNTEQWAFSVVSKWSSKLVLVTLADTELQDQVQNRGKAMLYMSFLYRRWERSLNTRIGPFPEYDAGDKCFCPSFKHGNSATMAIWAALESFPAGAPTETKRGRPVRTVSTSIKRSARASRVCLRHKAWQASRSHGLDSNLPLCEPSMLRRGKSMLEKDRQV